MGLLKPKGSYDRRKLLRKARRAAMRGRHKKAITLYERVRATEPEYSDVLRLLAAQRVRAGQNEEAWRDCRAPGVLSSRRVSLRKPAASTATSLSMLPRTSGSGMHSPTPS